MLIIVIFRAMRYTRKMCSKECDMYKEQKMKFDIADRRKETLKMIVKDFTSDFGKGTFKT